MPYEKTAPRSRTPRGSPAASAKAKADTGPAASSAPPPPAEKRVLDPKAVEDNKPNHRLLPVILAFLASAVPDCHSTLLVSRAWHEAVEDNDPWYQILCRLYPSFLPLLQSSTSASSGRRSSASSSSTPSSSSGRRSSASSSSSRRTSTSSSSSSSSLSSFLEYPRTAKDLLRLRLNSNNHTINKARDYDRLVAAFKDKELALILRHPTHGVVAEARIPIGEGEGYASLGGFHSMEVRGVLPISEYQECDLAFQVPAGEDLLVSMDWQVTECGEDADTGGQGGGGASVVTRGRKPKVSWKEEKDKIVAWQLTPEFPDELAEKFVGFIHGGPDEDNDPGAICFRLSINCSYPGKHADLDVDVLRETAPSAVTGFSVAVALNSFDISSPLQYLRLLSTLAVVARHDRPLQKARGKLMRRFPETFLVVEVLQVGMENEDGEEKEEEIDSFAMVPLADEKRLLACLNDCITPMHYVSVEGEGGGGAGSGGNFGLPALKNRLIRVALLDLRTDRWVVLSEKDGRDDDKNRQWRHHCRFDFLGQHVEVAARFTKTTSTGRLNAQVVAKVLFNDETLTGKSGQALGNAVVAWWRFLETCLTGVSEKEEGTEEETEEVEGGSDEVVELDEEDTVSEGL